MINNVFLFCFFSLLLFLSSSCSRELKIENTKNELPKLDHDVGYIPYESKLDKANYIVCDSTAIASGRNRIQYSDGTKNLKMDIRSNFVFKEEYKSFNGFIVVRFLINCEGQAGRYRAQALNLDFSPAKSPSDILQSTLSLIQGLDNWVKASGKEDIKEYLKFINLRFQDGKIQHVLL